MTSNSSQSSAAKKPTFVKPSSSVSSTQARSSSTSASDSSTQPDYSSTASEVLDAQDTAVPDVKVGKKKVGSSQEVRELAAKTVAEDLELWHNKFSSQVEEGAADIEERVDELSSRMVHHHSVMGKSLVVQLEETVQSEIPELKSTILDILKKSGYDTEKVEEEVIAAIRTVGLKIKNKAQDVRTWRQNYEQETEIAVTKAAQEHFDILQRTRDLAMQKIGMKWAWMDGVTYKHWKQYHAMKAQFQEWTNDLKQLVTSHPGLTAAQKVGTDIEDEAMGIAQEAAEELGRLKQVASWKAIAQDYTDDFDSATMKLAAEAVQQKVEEAAEVAGESVAEAVDSVTEKVESASENIQEGVESIHEEADEDVLPEDLPINDDSHANADTEETPSTESLAAPATGSDSDESSSATSLTDDGNDEGISSETLESESGEGPDQIQETIVETPDGSDSTEDVEAEPVESVATASVKPALFGAAAQAVPSRQPILDDDDDDVIDSISSAASVAKNDVPEHITSAAQSAYTAALANAANQYSSAMSAISVQISGKPKPTHEVLFNSASSAYFGAISAANSRLSEAATAASHSIYGTPTARWVPGSVPVPTVPSLDWERVQSIAQQNWQGSIDWAAQQYEEAKEVINHQYESAKVNIGVAEPTPSTYLEEAEQRAQKLLDQAKHNYYAGLGLAHARYSDFLSSASSAVNDLTGTPTPTDLKGSAESAASAVADSASQVGDKVAENWDFVVSQVSSQVYGAPTPTAWYVFDLQFLSQCRLEQGII